MRAFIVLAILVIGCGCRQKLFPESLSIEELVSFVNDKSQLQLNLELADFVSVERVSVERERLGELSISELLKLTTPLTNYVIMTNGVAFTLCPKRGFKNGVDFSEVAPTLKMTNVYPFDAGYALSKRVSFVLACGYPYEFTRDLPPQFTEIDLPFWPTNALRTDTYQIENISLRAALCILFNSQRKAYWIAKPLNSKRFKHVAADDKIVEFEVFVPEQQRSAPLYWSQRHGNGFKSNLIHKIGNSKEPSQ